jgi:anti-sigma B factor antagonist
MRLDIVEEKVGPVPVLRLLGSLDITTVDALRERTIHLLERNTPAVALDLAQVTLVDSCGMGALLGGKKRAVEQEVGFYLLDCPAPLQRLLDMVGLNRVMDFCTRRELEEQFPSREPQPGPTVSQRPRRERAGG